MSIFTGAGVAIITPFHADGSVNYEKLDELIQFHCDNGTDSIVICGTTGESSTLTEEEHMDCIKFTIRQTKGRIPVIAGTGSNCTRTAVEMSREAAESGADGVLLVTPYYNKATQTGLIAHYKAIAAETKAPIILYSVASRTGVNIEPSTVATLAKETDNIVAVKEASGNISQVAKILQLTDGKVDVYSSTVATLAKETDNIVAVKEASGNISQVAKILQLTDGKVDVYSGNDDQIVPILSLGGKGVISVLSNVAPRETHDICASFFAGDIAGSRALYCGKQGITAEGTSSD